MGQVKGSGISRRTFLKAGAAAAAGTLCFPAVVKGAWKNINNVIIARFGGGVRFQETFGDPRMPNLAEIARGPKSLVKRGSLYTHIYNDGDTTHLGATVQILTGKLFTPKRTTKENPKEPTIFEFYRKQKGRMAAAHKAVVIDHSTLNYHFETSAHPKYGRSFGGVQFQPRLITYHQLSDVIAREQDKTNDVCQRARALQDLIWVKEDFEHIEDPGREAPKYGEREKKFIAKIFEKVSVPRVKSGDELILHFAREAMGDKSIQPNLLLLNFAGPDIAHLGSYTDYIEQIQALDRLMKELWNTIVGNRHYANQTLLIVTPDCGRSLGGQGRAGFIDHQGRDEGCRHVWALFVGPGIPKNKRFAKPYSQLDLAPTIGAILGIPTKGCEGKVMPETK
ncbi:MAG: twin-arginine translocation signal domain-containing protein [Planctomycetota bacterium]|jgi:hypothetical protein